jgi:hypothetical protein
VDVARGHQLPEPALVDVALAKDPLAVEPESLQPSLEVEPGRRRAGEEKARTGMLDAKAGERLEELRDALARVDVPECADQRRALGGVRRHVRRRPRRMRDAKERACVPGGARSPGDVPGVDQHPGRKREDLARERELLRPCFPERRQSLVEHAMGEQPADHAVLTLHRVEVAVAVAAADRHAGDEMVEDEVVEHDEAGRPPEGVEDPAMGIRVVADMVNGEVDTAWRPLRPALDDRDIDMPSKRRQQQRGVVRDPRRLGRHRREVRDPHA